MRYDPLMILGFIAAISFLLFMLIGFFFPRFYEPFIPPHRRAEGTEETIVNELKQKDSIDSRETVEVVSESSPPCSKKIGREILILVDRSQPPRPFALLSLSPRHHNIVYYRPKKSFVSDHFELGYMEESDVGGATDRAIPPLMH